MPAPTKPAWLQNVVGPGVPLYDEDGEPIAAAPASVKPNTAAADAATNTDPASLGDALAGLQALLSAPDTRGERSKPATARPGQSVPTKPATEPADLLASVAPWGTTPPPERADRFVVGAGSLGMFPTDCVSGVYAPGGFTKTTVAAALCLSVAAGATFAGLPCAEGASLFVSLEDGAEEMHRKLGANCVTATAPELHEQVRQRVMVLVLSGDSTAKFTERYTFGRAMGRTTFGERLIATAKEHAKQCGVPVRLVVVDHARLAGGGDLNDSEAATMLMRELARVAAETGAAVVLLGHSPKSSLSPNRAAEFSSMDALGSGAMVDNARFAAVIFGPTEAERKEFGISPEEARKLLALRVIKSNYSEAGRAYFFRKVPVQGWGVVVPEFVTLQRPAPALRGDAALERRVVDYIAARPGLLTANKLAKECAGEDGPLKAGRPAVAAAVDRLIEVGRLAVREPTAAERSAGNLNGRTREVLYVPE